jgi:hypothetical protein
MHAAEAYWADIGTDDFNCVIVLGGWTSELLVTHDSVIANMSHV